MTLILVASIVAYIVLAVAVGKLLAYASRHDNDEIETPHDATPRTVGETGPPHTAHHTAPHTPSCSTPEEESREAELIHPS